MAMEGALETKEPVFLLVFSNCENKNERLYQNKQTHIEEKKFSSMKQTEELVSTNRCLDVFFVAPLTIEFVSFNQRMKAQEILLFRQVMIIIVERGEKQFPSCQKKRVLLWVMFHYEEKSEAEFEFSSSNPLGKKFGRPATSFFPTWNIRVPIHCRLLEMRRWKILLFLQFDSKN